ncbi:DUF1521 domain-containing protein [Pyxidicoccus xibeiensis]|uniref:DUF1521 domain-containing protein n=1 Tax=Pyxidicoccus xibeiensis TaxID=2906759 RepID=UPI0020A7279D|nr:DUF1521 domain-containing protein [Pyxidicoccus xibeiensis]MCP3141405.1 DUF1521 domain-containing protein [Pyxidicoccus xibeiensis]
MAGINSVGTTSSQRTNLNQASNLNEAELLKNLKLIESTVDQAIKQIESASPQLTVQSDKEVAKSTFEMVQKLNTDPQTGSTGGAFPSEAPKWQDMMRPKDQLKVDANGVITTPGGYKIEQLGQFEWKVSGPDGKHTRVWGDPHVDEGDGGKFDFKRNTTFVLGDGTEIHCGTKPWGNGMTVTGSLDITCGDDHIHVADIDKGKGKVGTIQKDGYDVDAEFTANHYGDTLKMGKESDDWSFQGHEVVGDVGGGDSFKTGGFLSWGENAIKNTTREKGEEPKAVDKGDVPKAMAKRQQAAQVRDEALRFLEDKATSSLDKLTDSRAFGFNPFRGADDLFGYDKAEHREGVQDAFTSVRDMFRSLDEISSLNDMVTRRNVFA